MPSRVSETDPMISIAEAIRIVTSKTQGLPPEEIALIDARGRVLAEDVSADTDLPPFNRAQMDGYAVRSADTQNGSARLRIVGESAAGRGWHHEMKMGEAVRIMTGAPVPTGADSVQQVELTRQLNDEGIIEILKPTVAGQFIVDRASEIAEGAIVLKSGETINAAMMAVLAAFGYARVKVYRRPRVAVIATGTELVNVEERPGEDEIRDSNTFSVGAYAKLAGAEVQSLPLAGDDPDLLRDQIVKAAKDANVLVLSGGVSMGVYDFTKTALRAAGAELFFERVSLRPGKPTVFARLGETLVFGLPGNPVSVSVTFNLFVRTALRAMQGASDVELKKERAILERSIKGAIERESYLPARLGTDEDGHLIAEPLKWGGSSDFVAFARATGLINVPAGVPVIEAGTVVHIVRLPG